MTTDCDVCCYRQRVNAVITLTSACQRRQRRANAGSALLALDRHWHHSSHTVKALRCFCHSRGPALTQLLPHSHSSLNFHRKLAFIAEFTTDIRYVKVETNFVADALSRPSVSVIDNGPAINYKDLSIDQGQAAEFTRLRHSTSSTMNFKLLKSFDN